MEMSMDEMKVVWSKIFESCMGVKCKVQFRRNGAIVFVVPADQAKRWEDQADVLRNTKEMDMACDLIYQFKKEAA